MSTSVFAKQNSSPVQTRRTQIKSEDNQNNRRSLSGKFRNLFQKNSSSPNRSPQPSSRRQRSPSPESVRTITEAPHLRAPIISWPFGKKKTKVKDSKKSKKKSTRSIEISSPIYQQEHETSIRGQNFVPRTPELVHGGTGRTQSSSSFEITTKGFRDYTVLDNKRSSQKVIISDLDVATPPPYVSDHSRSPSLHRQRLPDTHIEHTYHNDISSPRSDIEITPIRKQNSTTNSSTLVEQNPLFRSTISKPINGSTISNQWKNNTSYSSSNNSEVRSTLSSSKEADIPKLNVPLISLSSTSSKKESKRINVQSYPNDTYNSLSTVSNITPTNQAYTKTYGSVTDSDAFKSTETNYRSYPGLSAIVEHHMLLPKSNRFEQRIPGTTSPKRAPRFDTSTTTLNGYDDRPQWTTTIHDSSSPSPASIHRHDGFIRPLTPQKSLIQPDISTIHVNLDDLRGQSPTRTSYHQSSNTPIMYRSSTTIYTKDKHNYNDGGELRTWSIQRNDDMNNNHKGAISFQLIPTKTSDEVEEEYIINPYSNNFMNSNFLRSSVLNERDKIYDQSTRSYKQESFNTITPVDKSEVALRHYTLKRTDSYNGFGIIISADSDTRLNHRIRDIEVDSPASRTGLRRNDRIIKVNGVNVENMIFDDVLKLIKQGLKNNNLQFSVL